MNTNRSLFIVLIAQILLVFGLYLSDQSAATATGETLLGIQAAEITQIKIADQSGQVELLRNADSWTITGLDELPADSIRIESALAALAEIKPGFAVATTESASERFEVSPGNFQKRIELQPEGNEAVAMLLGTSPGFRKVHARVTNTAAVYAIQLNSFDFPAEAAQWLNKNLLAIDGAAITGSNNEAQADAFASLRILGIADADSVPARAEDATYEYRLTADSTELLYSFWGAEDTWYVQRSDIDHVFTLSKLSFDQITQLELE